MKTTKPVKRSTVVPEKKQEVHYDLYRDGVSQSLIAKFLICRHRFWIRTVLGLEQDGGFNHRIEHGNLMHAGFEAFAAAKNGKSFKFEVALKAGLDGVERYAIWLRKQYPKAETIHFWQKLALGQFELYCKHWRRNDEKRQYVFQEQVFKLPIKLPSGRVVPVRGKLDEGFRKDKINVLQENKCKGDVDEEGITSSLHHDLQTGVYMSAANRLGMFGDKVPCTDLLYNVIKRPLGGKYGSIRQKKDETEAEFIGRILDGIRSKPADNFMRWSSKLTERELKMFENRTLFPILEQMADWWDSIKENPLDPWNSYGWDNGQTSMNHHHFCRPFGVFDSLALGNRGDYFDFLMSGQKNKIGLKQAPLFQELTNPSLSEK